MTTDRILAFVVVGLSALLIGATTEQSALVTILGRANLSEDCRQQIDRAVQGIIEEHEGAPQAPSQ